MAKRRKMIYAGRMVCGVVYSAAYPSDAPHVRQGKVRMSTQARQAVNLRRAWQKLELLLAANFDGSALVLGLTYRDADLPRCRAEAVRRLKRFIARMREHRRRQGRTLPYIYVTEGLHTQGRLHHHMVIDGGPGDLDAVRALWEYGEQVEVERLDIYGYEALAKYLTKEPRECGGTGGARSWTPSRGLKKPEEVGGWVSDDTALSPPAGCTVLERREAQNEFGGYTYIKYLLPEFKPRKVRAPSRRGGLTDGILACPEWVSSLRSSG